MSRWVIGLIVVLCVVLVIQLLRFIWWAITLVPWLFGIVVVAGLLFVGVTVIAGLLSDDTT